MSRILTAFRTIPLSAAFLAVALLHTPGQAATDRPFARETDLSNLPWYALKGQVDPARYLTKGAAGYDAALDWVRVKVPQSLHIQPEFIKRYPLPQPDKSRYIQALLTFSEPDNYSSYITTVWYKLELHFDKRPVHNLALRLGAAGDSVRLYVNGHHAGAYGNFDKRLPEGYDKIHLYSLPSGLLKQGRNTILVESQNFFAYEVGIQKDRVSIGPESEMFSAFTADNYSQLYFMICYLTVGIYFLFLYLSRRQDRQYLAYTLMTLLLVAYSVLKNQIKYSYDIDFYLLKRIEYLILIVLFPVSIWFGRLFMGSSYTRFNKVLEALSVIEGLFILLHPSTRIWSWMLVAAIFPLAGFYLLYFGYLFVDGIRNGRREVYFILSGVVILIITAVMDMLSVKNVINMPPLSGFGFIVFVVGLGAVMAYNFVWLSNENEELNANLEQKVRQRTHELKQSLEQVQSLKNRQDGDYYLTSMLITPLAINRVHDRRVEVHSITRQKKKFSFKQWNAEIGGDICIAHNVELRGRLYTAFLNADAMGKSIQGAGGALVLGSLFNAYVKRTAATEYAGLYPEQWVRNCYSDISAVFDHFDGSMMISTVFGVVDNQSGYTWFINAEHPFAVLYRDGQAGFVEKGTMLRKIGTPVSTPSIQVKTFQMLPGDRLVLGSDGRDDIILNEQMNYDEELFLKSVEAGKGEPAQMAADIEARGRITDDLSLMTVQYNGDADFVRQRQTAARSAEGLNGLVAVSSGSQLEEIMHLYPGERTILAAAARRLFELGEVQSAREVAERLRLRNPDDTDAAEIISEIEAGSV